MNVELLNKIKEQITLRPKQFNMDDWFKTSADIPECGTAACIGGWAATIANWDGKDKPKPSKGDEQMWGPTALVGQLRGPSLLLELGVLQSDRLFYTSQWPETFQEDYNYAIHKNDHTLAAQVACERIDHFIATEGRE